MKIGTIIQARTKSTRFPEKILKPLPIEDGISVLQHVIRRVKCAKKSNMVIVATTHNEEDDVTVQLADLEEVGHFRGEEEDVLSRYYYAAKENELNVVVRVTSDCPCVDPDIIDFLIEEHSDKKSDYTSNTLKRTFPHGLDAEVIRFEALERAFFNAKKHYEREHVTPYIWKNPHVFNLQNIEASGRLVAPHIRITLDTYEDYMLLAAVFDYLWRINPYFKGQDIVGLFAKKPWLSLINSNVKQKNIYDSVEEELEEAIKVLELQDLNKVAYILKKELERQRRIV